MNQALMQESLPQAARDRPAYRPPASVEEAEALKARLIDETTAIQAQLGERNKLNATGQRYRPEEYWAWRSKAVAALNAKRRELRQVKAWLSSQKRDRVDTVGHLKRLAQVLRELESEGVLEGNEQEALDQACAHLVDYGVNVERLKKDSDVRADLLNGFAAIKATLDPMVADAGTRQIVLADDDE